MVIIELTRIFCVHVMIFLNSGDCFGIKMLISNLFCVKNTCKFLNRACLVVRLFVENYGRPQKLSCDCGCNTLYLYSQETKILNI